MKLILYKKCNLIYKNSFPVIDVDVNNEDGQEDINNTENNQIEQFSLGDIDPNIPALVEQEEINNSFDENVLDENDHDEIDVLTYGENFSESENSENN